MAAEQRTLLGFPVVEVDTFEGRPDGPIVFGDFSAYMRSIRIDVYRGETVLEALARTFGIDLEDALKRAQLEALAARAKVIE